MSLFKREKTWWYESWFAGRRIQESARTASKTIAKLAEQKRRRELEEGFNSIEDRREERIRTIREVASDYLAGYILRNKSATFAEYAIGHLTRLLGPRMVVDADEAMVLSYQEQRLREQASPKSLKGFLFPKTRANQVTAVSQKTQKKADFFIDRSRAANLSPGCFRLKEGKADRRGP